MTTVQHSGDASARGNPIRNAPVGDKVVYVSTESSVPIYVQIAQQLTYLVYSRQLEPGFALPSVRVLAAGLGVTSNTISQAYAQLQATGLVSAHKGSGTYVNANAFERDEDWQVRNELAREAVVGLRQRFSALGLGDADLRQHVEGALHAPGPVTQVAFVAFTHASAKKYADAIEAALATSRVKVHTVTFGELESDQSIAREVLARVYYLITFVSTRSSVEAARERLGRRHRVIGISLELARDTVARLEQLLPDTKVAVVTTGRYVDIALNVIRSNSSVDLRRVTPVVLGGEGTGPVLAGSNLHSADLVIYTFGVSDAVEDLRLAADRRLLIDFRIDSASKDNLSRILTAPQVKADGRFHGPVDGYVHDAPAAPTPRPDSSPET